MGIDRPGRSSDDDQPRRPERRQPEQKPSEQDSGKQARPSRSELRRTRQEEMRELEQRRTAEAYRARNNSTSAAEQRQEVRDKQARYLDEQTKREGRSADAGRKDPAEAYRDRHNSMTPAERQQEARAKHEKAMAEEAKREARTPAEADAEAKAYLEQREARIEAYERGDLPRSQLSRSERHDATKRKFDRFVEAEKAKEGREATGADQPHPRAPEHQADSAEREAARRAAWEAARAEVGLPPTPAREREHNRPEGVDNPYSPTAEHADKPDGKPPDRPDTPEPAENRPAEQQEGRDADAVNHGETGRSERTAEDAAAARERFRQAEVDGMRAAVKDDAAASHEATKKMVEARRESFQTTWQTIAEQEGGEVRSFNNYTAAKRALGGVPGSELHHIVEQSQASPERAGFSEQQINRTDNMARVPPEVNRALNEEYGRSLWKGGPSLRDVLGGTSWEHQMSIGQKALEKAMNQYVATKEQELRDESRR